MCGIAGILSETGREEMVRQMLASIRHRGPDGEGYYEDGAYHGGMCRLAINDPQGGWQPLYNEDRSIVLLYNGEIYNSPSLREKLAAQGVRFQTHSDGEVIVHLYREHGEHLFELLDGMFAAALWIRDEKKLILARDIPGEKPLYFARRPKGGLVFASELKALRACPELPLTLDRQALWDFPSFLWIPEPRTVWEEVEALRPGHLLIAAGGEITVRPYANRFVSTLTAGADEAEVVATIRKTVEEAVISRLLSDVPVGSFLSGGLDSSIVATVASKHLPELHTFSIGFDDLDDPHHGRSDESEDAAQTARLLGTKHHAIHLTAAKVNEFLPLFSKHGDQPFSVSSGFGILAVAEEARRLGVKVLLSGDGADECFGGYSWYAHLQGESSQPDFATDTLSFNTISLSPGERARYIRSLPPSRRALAWHYYAQEADKQALFDPAWSEGLASSERHFAELNGEDYPEAFIRHDRGYYFPNEMLKKVDRMTMAFSVEGRAPFAAPSVLSLADHLKLEHMIKGDTLKWSLRQAFKDVLPAEVVRRPKHGFNVPVDHWLRHEWAGLLRESFAEGSQLRQLGIVGKNAQQIAVAMAADPSRMNGHTLFSFIMLNMWLENAKWK